ncbi:uncharacterized protein LOC123307505 isoform X2 [Coccinella septempunctata]|nr:uncharacterized protein LOC123307505 isoform X2 [Coccinella septempunctata]
MKDRVYSVELSLDAEDGIVTATCSCPRNQLVCHHMAALCVFGHHNLRLPMDMPCTSNAPIDTSDEEEDEVQSIEQIFPKEKKNYCAVRRLATEQEIEKFVNSLDDSVGFKWLLKPEPS